MRSPLKRYGGKGRLAGAIVPRLARARSYVEPFFGAGAVFFALPPEAYSRTAVNDLDSSLVTFFRVLRERPDDLLRVLSLTPYARDEFAAALEASADPLEEARRVWVRSRQCFSGVDRVRSVGRWSRPTGRCGWRPQMNDTRLAALFDLADRLRLTVIDNIDAAAFVDKWGGADTMVYADPPYVLHTRAKHLAYQHEMSDEQHRQLAAALHAAVARGARVMLSGYPSPLYEELFPGWRRVEMDVSTTAARSSKKRATEVLWLSYPAELELGHAAQLFTGEAA